MNYIESIQKAISILEESLKSKIDIDEICAKVYISKYHFYRLFTAIIGVPPMEYVRRRRLTESAKQILNSDDKIIEILLEYGFDSQEAFTRSFKQVFGITPAKLRKERENICFYDKCCIDYCKIKIKNAKGGSKMDVKVVEKEDIKIVGLSEKINMPDNTIPKLWEKFRKREHEIKNIIPKGCYGIAENMVELEDGFSFDELVGREVSSLEDIPEGMMAKVIKAQKFLVFTHKGELFCNGVSKLQNTYDYIYGKFLPSSEYIVNGGFNFEYYDERFIFNSPESEMDIYIPIK